jgi:hypothetical protein
LDAPAAISLLRQALGSRATVEWSTDAADGEAVTIRWAGASDIPRRLRLRAIETAGLPVSVPATNANADADADPVVWVLTRSTAARRDALRANGASFIDLRGAVHLTLPWALIDRTDLAPPDVVRKRAASVDPFADRSSLIVRTMLEQLHRSWSVRELARTADVALATTSDVIRTLTDRGLVTLTRAGRAAQVRIPDPIAMIETWAHAYDWRMNPSLPVHVPVGNVDRLLRRLPSLFGGTHRWALTLQAGASLRVPHATWDRVHVYVDLPSAHKSALTAFAAKAGWEPASDGRLVLLAPYYRTTVWHGSRLLDRQLPVVSDLQLIVDLWNYPLRGREQADVLLRSFIT